jgi:hypothetical protein
MKTKKGNVFVDKPDILDDMLQSSSDTGSKFSRKKVVPIRQNTMDLQEQLAREQAQKQYIEEVAEEQRRRDQAEKDRIDALIAEEEQIAREQAPPPPELSDEEKARRAKFAAIGAKNVGNTSSLGSSQMSGTSNMAGGATRRRKHRKQKTKRNAKKRQTNKLFKMFGFGKKRRTCRK